MQSAWLFAPANVERKAQRALASGADVIVLDLEDAVPVAEKAAARAALAAFAALPRTGGLMVRINAFGTAHCLRELEAAVQAGAHAIMLPKAETADEAGAVSRTMMEVEGAAGKPATTRLVPLVETARGLRDAGRVEWGSRVRQVAFGTVDYALELGLHGAVGDAAVEFARHALVLACRAAGLDAPIDGVTLAVRDAASTSRDATRARDMGFGGKLAIHPDQVRPIQDAFRPTAEELAWAAEVVAAFEVADAKGIGAIQVQGHLVDRLMLNQAKRLLT